VGARAGFEALVDWTGVWRFFILFCIDDVSVSSQVEILSLEEVNENFSLGLDVLHIGMMSTHRICG